MRKTFGLLTMLVLALGLTFSACGGGDDGDDGNNTNDVVTQEDGTTNPGDDTTTCTPACDGKVCGPDGCGGTCGTCEPGVPCNNGVCECTPDCAGKECGPDGCGGSCGECPEGGTCDMGICCVPDCDGKECGPDGCGGSCGACDGGFNCDAGMCVEQTEMDCAGIFDCLNECPPQDRGCQNNCINEAPVEAQMAFNNMMQCLQTSGYWDCPEDDQECLGNAMDQCEAEYLACFSGDLSCKDYYLCIINCPNDATGEACVSDCQADMSEDAYYKWGDFIDCIDGAGYFDCAEGDEQCYEDAWIACDAEFKACASGDTTCLQIMECLNACPPTSDTCAIECRINGTVEAQNAFEAMVDCIIEACGDDTSVECQNTAMQGACAESYNECMGQ